MLSLGTYPDVPLKRAREKRDEARWILADGINPAARSVAERVAAADSFEAVARASGHSQGTNVPRGLNELVDLEFQWRCRDPPAVPQMRPTRSTNHAGGIQRHVACDCGPGSACAAGNSPLRPAIQ